MTKTDEVYPKRKNIRFLVCHELPQHKYKQGLQLRQIDL